MNLFYHWVNFAILVVALVFFGRKKLKQLFTAQREQLRLEIDLTNSKYIQVKEELAAVEKLMSSMEASFSEMKTESLTEFNAEVHQLQEESREAVERYTRDSELKMIGERDKALSNLEKDLLDLAVSRAAETLMKEKRDLSREWLQQLVTDDQKDLESKKNYAS